MATRPTTTTSVADDIRARSATTALSPRRVLIDVDAAAVRLSVTPRFVRRLVTERRIPYFKVGKFIRFDPLELDLWLDNCRVEPYQNVMDLAAPSLSSR